MRRIFAALRVSPFPHRFVLTTIAVTLLAAVIAAVPAPQVQGRDEPTLAEHGMVVSVSAPAADVGRDILKKGGNAVDAAIATEFALAVTYPAAGNIGGGGFMLVYPGKGAEPVVIEYRETAPAGPTKTKFS